MSFDTRDLRRGMDVFSLNGVYLGTVVWVVGGAAAPRPLRTLTRLGGVAFSGESLGPMPTVALGNGGPRRQTAANDYASTSDSASDSLAAVRPVGQPTGLILVRLLTSLKWSTFWPRAHYIPVRMVQAVSHERIILSASESDLDV